MKTKYFGFETDAIENDQGRAVFQVLKPTTLTGYQFDLALGYIQQNTFPASLGNAHYAEVLFWFGWSSTRPTGLYGGMQSIDDTFGEIILENLQPSKNPGLHGSNALMDDIFCISIIKSWNQEAKDKSLIERNLSVPVQPGFLVAQVAHAGLVADFEFQGVLFFE